MCAEREGEKHLLHGDFYYMAFPLALTTLLCECYWFIWGKHSGSCVCLSKCALLQSDCLQASKESVGNWISDGIPEIQRGREAGSLALRCQNQRQGLLSTPPHHLHLPS